MPIMSYIAYPNTLGKEQLVIDLNAIDKCGVNPSMNKDIIILVTDTASDEEEKELQEKLKKVDSLSCLSLVYASDSETIEQMSNESNGGL